MEYESEIVKVLTDINEKFKTFPVSHDSQSLNYYDSLVNEEKDDYIKKYEEFFYIFGIFSFIARDLLIITKKLEDIRVERENEIKDGKPFATTSFWNINYNYILHLTTWLYNSITILLKITEDNNMMEAKKMRQNFPELNYIKCLRNEFLQHPKFSCPFHIINASYILMDKKKIPDAFIAPGGGGLTLITRHHNNKIKNKVFLQMTGNLQLEYNKNSFIKESFKWKDGQINEETIHKIKATGLPSYDQHKLTIELESLFVSIIFPFVEDKINTAKKENILFDSPYART